MAKKYLDDNGLLYFWQKIKNAFVSDQNYVHTDNNFTTTLKDKLDGVASGAEVNVQSDWNQTNTSADDYIKNKPTIPSGVVVDQSLDISSTNAIANSAVTTALNGKAVGNARVFYGTSSTGASTATKVVTCASYDALTAGDIITVKFTSANTATTPTLNVNSKGSKTIKQLKNGTLSALGNKGSVSGTCTFVYDGTYWVLQGADDDTTYSDATTSASGLMSSTDKGKVDKLVFNGSEIDSSILPSYVDDVVEAYPRSGQTELSSTWLSLSSGGSALTPETGKIYVLMADSTSYATNTQFRWAGSAYVKLADGGVSEITNGEIDVIVAS